MEAVVESLEQRPSGARGGVRHGAGFVGVHGERLLAEHRFAGFQGGDGEVRMAVRGQGVVDEIDARMGDQGFVAAETFRNAVLPGVGVRAVTIARGDTDNLAIIAPARGLDQGLRGYLCGPKYSHPYHKVSRFFSSGIASLQRA